MSDRIHVLSNGRSPAKKSGDFITVAQAEQMVMAERAENENMVKWYCMQIPELVAKMLGDALAVNGLVMKAPDAPPETEGPTEAEWAKSLGPLHVDQIDGDSTEPDA